MATILLIDDDRLVRSALSDLLGSGGYVVRPAESGREGISSFIEQTPDLVIADILMPDMDGIEVINKIREISPKQKIIAISGGGRLEQPHLLASVRNLFRIEAVPKPIENGSFLKLVGTILAH